MKVFLFDNGTNSVIVNEPEVLLIKEFAALWTNERNKKKEEGRKNKKKIKEKKKIII